MLLLKLAGKSFLWALAFALFSIWGILRRPRFLARLRPPRPAGGAPASPARRRRLPPPIRLQPSRSAQHEPPPLDQARSILAIRLDLMGDLIFTLPAIRALAESAPDARITMLVLPYTAELLEGLPYVQRVIASDVNGWRRPGAWLRGEAFREFRRVLAALRGEQYDLCVSFYGRVAAAFALMSGAKRLVGYRSEGYPNTFDVGLPGRRYAERKHESEYCLALSRATGAYPAAPGDRRLPSPVGAGSCRRPSWVPDQRGAPGRDEPSSVHGPLPCPLSPAAAAHPAGSAGVSPARARCRHSGPGLATSAVLVVAPEAAARVDRLLANEGLVPTDRLVTLHPGTLIMAPKRWPPDRWAAVADRVQRLLGRTVVLVGSASEASLVQAVARAMQTQPTVLAGKTSLAELAALLHRSELFLGGDSGPLHVASALGVPSVSVYGPTDPALTGPLGDRATVVRSGVACSPCYDPRGIPECSRGDVLCMQQVSTEEVFEAVCTALREQENGRAEQQRPGARASRPRVQKR